MRRLVNNEPFLDLDPGHWQATLDLNLNEPSSISAKPRPGSWSSRRRCDGQAANARPVRGKILFNGSWGRRHAPAAEGCSYAVAKAGLKTMVKAMATNLVPVHGVRCQRHGSGHINGRPLEAVLEQDPKLWARVRSPSSHCGSSGTVGPVADASVFLASDRRTTSPGQPARDVARVSQGGTDLMRFAYVPPNPPVVSRLVLNPSDDLAFSVKPGPATTPWKLQIAAFRRLRSTGIATAS